MTEHQQNTNYNKANKQSNNNNEEDDDDDEADDGLVYHFYYRPIKSKKNPTRKTSKNKKYLILKETEQNVLEIHLPGVEGVDFCSHNNGYLIFYY